jgi:hypothetical protein
VRAIRSHLALVKGLDTFSEHAVWEKIHLRDTDSLLLSGSLVDGSGTPTSDLDFCVIALESDDRFDRETFPRHAHMRYYTSGNKVKASFDYQPDILLGVDVEYKTSAEIHAMLDAHDSLYAHMQSRARKSSSYTKSSIDFRLLSRLTYGVVIQDFEFDSIRIRVKADEVAFTAYRTAIGSFPDFRDLVGMIAQEDYVTASVAARKLATDTFRGLTHVYGNTNRNPKYLTRFLERLPSSLGELYGRFLELYAWGDTNERDRRESVLAWLDLIDEAYDEIRRVRDHTPAFNSREDFIELLKSEFHEDMGWNAEISNEYCFRAREAVEGLPSLRDLVDAMVERSAVAHSLPLRQWSVGRSAPTGENNKVV